MTLPIPRTTSRPMQFTNGSAIGISNRWHRGQYCTILTPAGIVGCGIYDLKTAGEFGQLYWMTAAEPRASAERSLTFHYAAGDAFEFRSA